MSRKEHDPDHGARARSVWSAGDGAGRSGVEQGVCTERAGAASAGVVVLRTARERVRGRPGRYAGIICSYSGSIDSCCHRTCQSWGQTEQSTGPERTKGPLVMSVTRRKTDRGPHQELKTIVKVRFAKKAQAFAYPRSRLFPPCSLHIHYLLSPKFYRESPSVGAGVTHKKRRAAISLGGSRNYTEGTWEGLSEATTMWDCPLSN